MIADVLDIAMFATVCAVLLAGFPVAFSIAGTALAFALLGAALGVLDLRFVAFLPQRIFGTMQNEVLVAVPLFVFMGVMLERSKVAEDLLESMGRMFGSVRGGLGVSVSVVGALLAASTGIVGATVVTMGLLSLPTMLRHGYDKGLACGSICAAGTLGQIIPPSIVLVLLGDQIGTAYQASQLQQGIFAPETVSVGDLFAGALVPGLLLVTLYVVYQMAIALVRPSAAPALHPADTGGEIIPRRHLARALVPPIVLMVAVLGSILGGIATPTEAAGVGAVGALMLAGLRLGSDRPWLIRTAAASLAGLLILTGWVDLRVTRETIPMGDGLGIALAGVLCLAVAAGIGLCLWRTYRLGVLQEVMRSTAKLTSMVFVIVLGAALFSLVFRGLGGDHTVEAFLTAMPGGLAGALVTVMAVMFVLGFFLDFLEITFVVVPVVAPVLLTMGVDPVWLGILMAVNLQTSFLTPPFGFALFYLRGVAPPEVSTTDIYRGIVPFVAIQLLALGLIAAFPPIATWLPSVLFR